MLLIVKRGMRGGICHAIYRYVKANNEHMKNCDKDKRYSCLKYWDVNNWYVWAMSQKLPVNDFKWVENISKFDQSLDKVIMKKMMKKISLNRMETKFMNSTKSKTSDPPRLLINLSGKNT